MVDKIPKGDYRGMFMEKWPPIPAKFLKAYQHGVERIAGGDYSNREKAEGHRWLHWLMCEWPIHLPEEKKETKRGKKK